MEQLWITLPALAPDYSGVCSAVFDLGGVTVIHDASGCTGNYTGYDEPRWYGSTSKIFCSGLREIDAVLGRDDKLIEHTMKAGNLVNPTIYTVTGSPVPMVIGSDMKGIAHEIEAQTGVPSFGFDTNGLGLYNQGISMVMCEVIKRFTKDSKEKIPKGINILGSNALDFAAKGNAEDLTACLESWGFQIIGKMMMGADIGQIEDLAKAEVNLVVTESGMAAAKLLHRKYGTPYVVGMSVGKEDTLREALEQTIEDQTIRTLCDDAKEGGILIVAEQVLANSMRKALLAKNADLKITVGTLYGLNRDIAGAGDLDITSEERLIQHIYSGKYKRIVGDPLFEDLLSEDCDVSLVKLPHVALSSKLYWNKAPRFIGEEFEELLAELAMDL